MTIMVNPAQLAIAAERLFHRLQTIQEFKTIRVLIIGDLAAWKYIAKRNISDIEMLVELGPGFNPRLSELPTGAIELLKLGLTVSYPEEFYQPVEQFKFRMPQNDIPVHFLPCEVSPYVPQSAMTVSETQETRELPFISALDLAIFKIYSSGLRGSHNERETDACDAAALVRYVGRAQSIRLSPQQREAVLASLDCDFFKASGKSKRWWWLVLNLH